MRQVTQATVSRLPSHVRGPRWSSWISALAHRRSRSPAKQAERRERLYRQHLQRTRPVQVGFDPARQWIRRV